MRLMETAPKVLSGNIVDVIQRRIFRGRIHVEDGVVRKVDEDPDATGDSFFSPGLIDAHVHVESSLLSPVEFARAAVAHGTLGAVCDPHEIANVLGIEGVGWMIRNGSHSPFHFLWGAPSCVPATPFETAGAKFGPEEVATLLDRPGIGFLSEVMNFPAVIQGDEMIMDIVAEAKKRKMPVDGHAPGVMGEDLEAYAGAGIETDHECVTLEEGRARCRLGMKVAIREGTAARNFDQLWPLLNEFPDGVFLCTDDQHPDELETGYINRLCAIAVSKGVDPMTVLCAATVNPVRHYRMDIGLLQPGDAADFVEWRDLNAFSCLRSWIRGQLVAKDGVSRLPRHPVHIVNEFNTNRCSPADFQWKARRGPVPVIVAEDGQLITGRQDLNDAGPDTNLDLLRIVVVNRYRPVRPAVGLIRNFGLKKGAIASSVAHDSHNIVCVGTDEASIAGAVNLVIECNGGLSAYGPGAERVLPLPVAGLMSDGECSPVGAAYRGLSELAREWGCAFHSPYMTLSFMALLVIPRLKLSDRGLFDVDRFELIS